MTSDPLAEIDALLARVPKPYQPASGEPFMLALHKSVQQHRAALIALAPEMVDALRAARAVIAGLEAERDRANRNRDMWRDQCERQAAQIERMRGALIQASVEAQWDAEYPPDPDTACREASAKTIAELSAIACDRHTPPGYAEDAGNAAKRVRNLTNSYLAACAEVDRLRGALENIMFADIPRSLGRRWRTDGEPSDHDECTHGAMMGEDCVACLDAYIKGVLGIEGGTKVYPGGGDG